MEERSLQNRPYNPLPGRPDTSTNLADILERVLDKGIVIAGDIQINLLEVELLTIKLRLLIASVDRAREMGINWWESDASLQGLGPGEESDRGLTSWHPGHADAHLSCSPGPRPRPSPHSGTRWSTRLSGTAAPTCPPAR